jgi:hypothetical protein
MSTTARKARKRAGIKFERTSKAATPLYARSGFQRLSEDKQKDLAADRGHVLTGRDLKVLAKLRPAKQIRTPRNYSR